ncbi:hypothetical protein PITCH_A1590003 [uncultured Desulfobacterium sp.]|uniref:Uncharacterized protein n=1 Tax=uncultured Desulfobacterium sp. TaxID=201089 RepID=A0A445MU80_9BACT|nr:hypothetical protein PITCH_A1590003 [uncultured Desulfobacterium sp.]
MSSAGIEQFVLTEPKGPCKSQHFELRNAFPSLLSFRGNFLFITIVGS